MKKKVVLITGTTRGIGKTIKELLFSQGYTTYGSAQESNPNDEYYVQLDVTDPDSCKRAVDYVIKREGTLDVLVNNAGFHITGAFEEISLEELHQQMDLNFYGAVHMIKAVTGQMLKQKSGNIINISAINGQLATPYTSAYSASKSALEGYTEALRLELIPFNIYVSNTVCAFVNTGTTQFSIRSPKKPHNLFVKYRELLHEDMLKNSPNGISLEKVAQTVRTIIESKEPKFRYTMDKLTKRLLRMSFLLPEKTFHKGVLKALKMPLKVQYDYKQ